MSSKDVMAQALLGIDVIVECEDGQDPNDAVLKSEIMEDVIAAFCASSSMLRAKYPSLRIWYTKIAGVEPAKEL